ncbi:MAG: hypothetical protein ACTSV7_14890 [Candidatus Baldrarchaeia archaeon]
MAWWIPFLALFEIPVVGTIFAGLFAMLGVSVLGIFMPTLKTIFAGAILLALAYFVPDVTIVKTQRLKITLRNILGIAGIMCFINLAFGISLPSFGSTVIASITSNMPAGTFFDDVKSTLSSVIPEGVEMQSLGTIAMVYLATIVVVYFLGSLAKKRRGRR